MFVMIVHEVFWIVVPFQFPRMLENLVHSGKKETGSAVHGFSTIQRMENSSTSVLRHSRLDCVVVARAIDVGFPG